MHRVSLAKETPFRASLQRISPIGHWPSPENARKHDVSDRIRFLEGDLFGPLAELDLHEMVDIIVSNPPYVRSGDLPRFNPR
jgi:release factor glutamine methyltransferase